MAPADLKSLKVDMNDFPPLRRLGRKTPGQNAPYHERQRQAMCALHAINAALGGSEFSVDQLRRAAEGVVREAAACASAVGQASEERLSNHMLDNGWISEQALAGALEADGRWQFDQIPLRLQPQGLAELAAGTLVCDACP